MASALRTNKSKSAANKQNKIAARRYLPDKYEPRDEDVLIGRGRRVDNHRGNHRFKDLIRNHVVGYYNAQTKATKTIIILRIFQDIKQTAEAEGGAGFIKQEYSSKRWFVIDDSAARISIAQAFRDFLAGGYKSSKVYKQQKRKEQGRFCFEEQFTTSLVTLTDAVPTRHADASNFLSDGVSNDLDVPPPPALVPTVSADDHDLSHRLREMLVVASSVVMADEDDWMGTPTSADVAVAENDLFSCLYSAVGSSMDLTKDPFEPTPILEAKSKVRWEPLHEKFLPFELQESPVVRSMVDHPIGLSYQAESENQEWERALQQ